MCQPNIDRSVSRLIPDEPFPSYSYVPGGQYPHPTSDPAGHSYGIEPAPPVGIDSERWAESRPYLYGIDLFNGGFYWESHVAWESLWLASGRSGVVADFLKGLIHLAAAGVKHLEGMPAGVKSHSHRASELWRKVASSLESDQFMGLKLIQMITLAETIHRAGWPADRPVIIPQNE